MAWIKIINENEAVGELKEIYDEIIEKRGKLSNIMKIHSLMPKTMKKHLDLYIELMFCKSKISREERELIATAVSVTNKCQYCTLHHAEALNHYWKDKEKLNNFIKDVENFPLDNRKRAMINYAVKLTKDAAAITEADIEHLKQVGLSEEEILHLNLITSYFNFVNRLANGLGVEFSEEEIRGYKY